MTPIAVILAAALGVGQVPTQEPSLIKPLSTGGLAGGISFINDYAGDPYGQHPLAQAKSPTGVEKPAPCCDKDCPCPYACMGKKTSGDDDYAWLNDALDALSDTADLVGDVVSAMWPFQTPTELSDHPFYLYNPPSPPVALVPQETSGLVKIQYQVEETSPVRPSRITIQGSTARSEYNVIPSPVPVAPATVAWQVQAPQTMQCPAPNVYYPMPPLPGSNGSLLPPVMPSAYYPMPSLPGSYNQLAPEVMQQILAEQGRTVNMVAVPPTPSMAKTTIKVVPKGDHHVLAISQGESTLVCKKTTIEVAGQDLVFTTGPSRVHVHGRSFEASATKVVTQTDNTLLLEGDVHLNCDDHGKAMVYKGSKAVVELKGDQVNLSVEKH